MRQRERLMYQQGAAPQDELFAATAWVAELERDRDHLRLDRAEMEAARSEVDVRLSAPLVGPRDFVSEHLRIDRMHLERIVDLRTKQEAIAEARFEGGMATSSTFAEAKHLAQLVRSEVAQIDARLALRAEFLLERIDALECENRDLIGDAEFRRARYQSQAKQLDTQIEYARRLEESGLASGDVTRLRSERDVVEVELRLIEFELELLR